MKAERKATPARPQLAHDDYDYEELLVSAERVDRYARAANEIPTHRVRHLRGDLDVARYNLELGMKAVLAHEARIRAELPAVDLDELRSLPDLWLALRFAAVEARDRRSPHDELPALLTEARKLRKLLLASAESLVLAGALPAHVVANVRKGKGPFDTATDCVLLADIFRRHDHNVRRKSPVTRQQIEMAHSVGETLMKMLTPERARSRKDEPWRVAGEMRDRLWTLLFERHETLWKVGAYLFGHEVNERVPYLQTRVLKRKKGET